MLRLLSILLLLQVFCTTIAAQVLDNSFGVNGIVKMPFEANGGGSIQSIAQQADGKIIALGGGFRIIRYHLNGVVDSSFAVNGRLVNAFDSNTYGSANEILIQPDGKIVVCGTAWDGNNASFAIARLNQNGTPDVSFNGTGNLIIDISSKEYCNSMALQPDGKIILCGEKNIISNKAVVVIRLNPDGTVDSAFNNGQGIFTAPFGIWSSNLNAVIAKPDGKILACGNVNNGGGIDFLLLQLHADGQIDSAFGNDGVVITPGTGFGHDFALQQDGRIVIVGRDVATGGHMARYMPDGSLDNSFGTNGHVLISHPLGIPGTEQVEIDNNGKIYAAGHITVTGSDENMFLMRFNTNGIVDADYAPDGIVTQVSADKERTYSMLIQQDGRILTAGYVNISFGDPNLCMLRFWPFSLSVNSVIAENGINVFPNPATDVLYLEIAGIIQQDCNYTIANIAGQLLQQGELTDSKINIANIPKGIHTIQITNRTSGSTTYTRFCKL